ncbi:dUTP diphosphatase [Cytobacillus sp. FJAT-53684]|uniref:dUTP diphosphatase n=1 Tax=Cytobacillus mangrovibacter TaxID=3299024 RepID=A0ABW6K198_9BACI
MNLKKLFDQQRILRDRIGYNEPDRFDKLILALLVELGECANEWRGFKFWSKNQEPRKWYERKCHSCTGKGYFITNIYTSKKESCGFCRGTGFEEQKNPLLEEYVDGFHFVLEIGLELNFTELHLIGTIAMPSYEIHELFTDIYGTSLLVKDTRNKVHYSILVEEYLVLGEMFGFTREEIETAYYVKNAVNHARQENGY